MGTQNFSRMFFKNVYAVDDTYEDDDGNTESDEYVVNDTIDNIKAELSSKIGKIKNFTVYDAERYGNDRNYPSKVFGTVEHSIDGYGVELHCVSGYYGGANFDIKLYYNGDTYNTIDGLLDAIDRYEEYYGSGKSMSKTKSDIIEKRMMRLINLVESVYRDCTDKLTVAGVFSDGTALYQKA